MSAGAQLTFSSFFRTTARRDSTAHIGGEGLSSSKTHLEVCFHTDSEWPSRLAIREAFQHQGGRSVRFWQARLRQPS